jgi:hypothetical protein
LDLRETIFLLEKRKKVVVVRFNKRMFVCLLLFLFFLSATKRVVDFDAFQRLNKP